MILFSFMGRKAQKVPSFNVDLSVPLPVFFCLCVFCFHAFHSLLSFCDLGKTVVWLQRSTRTCQRPALPGPSPTRRWWWREGASRNWRNACRSSWAVTGGQTQVLKLSAHEYLVYLCYLTLLCWTQLDLWSSNHAQFSCLRCLSKNSLR